MSKVLYSSICLVLSLLCFGTAAAKQKKILIINSYHAEYPWVIEHNDALREALSNKVELVFSYMDTKRIPKEAFGAKEAEALETVDKEQPDLVILTDDYALKSLGNTIAGKDIPVVYLGINGNPRAYFTNMNMITGVLERPLLKRSIAYLKDMMEGSLKRCLVLFDDGTTAQTIFTSTFKERKSASFYDIETSIKLHSSFNEWKTSVLEARKNGFNAIILGLYHTLIDEKGNHVPDDEIAFWTSANSPVPVFGFWDFSVGKGKAIGGYCLAGRPQGEEAANMALRILSGEPPINVLPSMGNYGRLVFSKHELKRWEIELPKNYWRPNEPILYME